MNQGTKVGLLGVAVLVSVVLAYYAFGPARVEAEPNSIDANDVVAQGDAGADAPTPTNPADTSEAGGTGGITTQLNVDAFGNVIDEGEIKLKSGDLEPADVSPAEANAKPAATQPATMQPAATQPAASQPASTQAAAIGVAKVETPDNAPPAPRDKQPPVIGVEHEPDRLIMGDPAEKLETYIVEDGDSMWVIARKTLGAGHKWQLIAKANPHINPDRIKAGDRLIIPRPAAEQGPVSEKTPTDPLGLGFDDKSKTVTVGDNESLWKIAEREYGDGLLWKHIYTANRDKLKNPDAVRAGMKLVVPPLPRD